MNEKIRDLMTRDVECAKPDMTVREAAERMKTKDFGSLPVCDGKKILGVITDRDITIRVTAEGRDPGSTRVADVMTKEVHTVKEDMELQEAERIMHDQQIRRLPVVDQNEELVGYLAMAKIARAEKDNQAGRVLKGVSQSSKPKPMETGGKRSRKTG